MRIFSEIAKDAWDWKIFREVQHRKDFDGLQGLDWRVLQEALRTAPPRNRPALTRLQDGTFLEPSQHSKYDLRKETTCQLCGREDSLTHRCTSCPARQEIYDRHAAIVHRWEEMTQAKKLHLLPSEKSTLAFFQETGRRSTRLSGQNAWRRGCTGMPPVHRWIQSWVTISPSSTQCMGSGERRYRSMHCLWSVWWTGTRERLCRVVRNHCAVEYALTQKQETNIWTDSTYAAEGTIRLLQDIDDLPDGQHQEDWLQLQGLLCQRDHCIREQHVPGQAKWDHWDQDLDSWLNDRADREANMAMKLHSPAFLRLHRLLLGHHERELADIKELQSLHIDINEIEGRPGPCLDGDEDAVGWLVERGCPTSPSPIGILHSDTDTAIMDDQFGQTFVQRFLGVLRAWHDDPGHIMLVQATSTGVGPQTSRCCHCNCRGTGTDNSPRVYKIYISMLIRKTRLISINCLIGILLCFLIRMLIQKSWNFPGTFFCRKSLDIFISKSLDFGSYDAL